MADRPQNTLNNLQRGDNRLIRATLMLCLVFGLAACDRSQHSDVGQTVNSAKKSATERRANPVESKDGLSYIPIDDTAFLIPEKTWLKGYGRKSTDGSVASITLHATVPDVQPWSQERHDEMYWSAGPGKKLDIYIEDNRRDSILVFENTLDSSGRHIEEPSDQAAQGLRQFRALWLAYGEERAKEDLKKYGADFVKSMRATSGSPMKDRVYYQFIVDGRTQYRISCDDQREKTQLWMDCQLIFPIGRSLMVRVVFLRDHLEHIISMADKLRARLIEFEKKGLAYRAAKSISEPSTSR